MAATASHIDSIMDRFALGDTLELEMPMPVGAEATHFPLPPNGVSPSEFVRETFQTPEGGNAVHFAHGTTTLSFTYDNGIVVAVDSRATMGNYISSQTVNKVLEINPYLLGTMAGGAADCAFWERDLGRRMRMLELQNKERPSVCAASQTLANTLFYYKGYGLSIGTMICGWDKTGPNIYYCDSEGSRIKGNRFSVGSGATFALGVLDNGYRKDLSEEEACELGRRSIYHATHRDAYSGGIINVYHITADGWRKVSSDDSKDLHYKYAEERKQRAKE